MLRQQKIYQDDATYENTGSASGAMNDGDTEPKNQIPSQKPILTHTYSNLSDKSFIPPEPPHTIRTTLIQLDFVKSSFTVNPCMVSKKIG